MHQYLLSAVNSSFSTHARYVGLKACAKASPCLLIKPIYPNRRGGFVAILKTELVSKLFNVPSLKGLCFSFIKTYLNIV
ncbi:hypothetical protein MGMO_98c00250 [Methyloglobulus morosus KoM1]|uniref:Uncharacterized protein n=1 Tax=Methyloglobulus morosus KoM1 TaxID=1116472 RepID=V5DW00_9GAMM|nr:hypothetical protein MGMO_98c00250 [Methyloglobulus morosus KoM1]